MSEINEIASEQIEQIRKDCENGKKLVAIRCITYNHEPYIRDALEGFVMQKTDFPFVAIVHDDASTDGTAAIIREYAEKYPDIIKPIYETENQYSKHDGSLGRIMNEACNATGAKYIAICEGDDYWTDPLKLQKQVDFLESHPDYGMCYTSVIRLKQQTRSFEKKIGGANESFEDLIILNTIPTLSVVIKSKILERYFFEIAPGNKKWLMGDFPIWLFCSVVSKIRFLDVVTGVYRVLQNSASHFTDQKKWYLLSCSYRDIQLFFWQVFSKDYGLLEKINIGSFKTVLHIRTVNDTTLINQCNEALDRIVNLSKLKRLLYWELNNNKVVNSLLKLAYYIRDKRR